MHSTLQKIAVLIQHNAVSQRDYHFLHVFYYLEPYKLYRLCGGNIIKCHCVRILME